MSEIFKKCSILKEVPTTVSNGTLSGKCPDCETYEYVIDEMEKKIDQLTKENEKLKGKNIKLISCGQLMHQLITNIDMFDDDEDQAFHDEVEEFLKEVSDE